MLNNTIIAVILLVLLGACAGTKSTNKGTIAQPTTTSGTQSDSNKYKAHLSKLPAKSTHEILYDK
jgi:hypothetical protein